MMLFVTYDLFDIKNIRKYLEIVLFFVYLTKLKGRIGN